jgi:hypothetical protein
MEKTKKKASMKRGPKIPRAGDQRVIALQCRPSFKRLIDEAAWELGITPNDWLEFRICALFGERTPDGIRVRSLKTCLKEVLAAQYPNEHGVQRDIPYAGYEALLSKIRVNADHDEMRSALAAAGVSAKHIGLVLSVVHRLAIGVGGLVYISE